MLKIGFYIFFFFTLSTASLLYKKILHQTNPQARCLDGSTPMIYLHQGGDKSKILFHLIGGGACMGTDIASTLQSCYKRSKGQFGSSTKWPDTYDSAHGGILSADPSQSAFANWTKVILMYCDGAFHQGYNKGPIKYKDTQLYFRGAMNTRGHFDWTDKQYNLSAAEKIVLTGSSAGGMATYIWHSYLRSRVPHPQRVYAIADSGIFYDPLAKLIQNQQYLLRFTETQIIKNQLPKNMISLVQQNQYQTQQQKIKIERNLQQQEDNPIQILMKLSNVDQRPPNKQCSGLFTEQEQWKCIFIQFTLPMLVSPILFIQSSYDQFLIQYIFGYKCVKQGVSGYTIKDCANWQLDFVQLYRAEYLQRFLPSLVKYGHSIWSISCCWHAQLFNSQIYDSKLQKVPKNTGLTIREASQSFVFQNKRITSVDINGWPSNTPCAY